MVEAFVRRGLFIGGLRGSIALLMVCMWVAVAAVAQGKSHAALVDPNLPDYQPQSVPAPHDHGYVMPDGSLRIVGFDDMAGMVAKWDEEFTKTHAGIRFTPILKGNGTAIPAITYDMAVFAPEGGGASLLELLPYEKIYGSKKDPVAALIIRVAHGSLNPAATMSPLGIIVNKSNPIKSLTKEQVASIFGTGSGTGDVTNWSQIGMGGVLADKPIHPTGLYWDSYNRPDDPYMGEYMMYRQMGPFPGAVFTQNYEQHLHYSDVVKKVANDPLAIGIVTLNKVDASSPRRAPRRKRWSHSIHRKRAGPDCGPLPLSARSVHLCPPRARNALRADGERVPSHGPLEARAGSRRSGPERLSAAHRR